MTQAKVRRLSQDAWCEGPLVAAPVEILLGVADFLGPTLDLLNFQLTCTFLAKHDYMKDAWRRFMSAHFQGLTLASQNPFPCSASSKYFLLTHLATCFRLPCNSLLPRVDRINSDDEVLYFNLRITENRRRPIFMEIEVAENSDNLSLAIVDFDGSGKSSVTFSPDTGAIIREAKQNDRVEGFFTHALQPLQKQFLGKIGFYMEDGKFAFFRNSGGGWETTGFCCDISSLPSGVFTPCIAFRDSGRYSVRISKFTDEHPLEKMDRKLLNWQPLNWFADDAA